MSATSCQSQQNQMQRRHSSTTVRPPDYFRQIFPIPIRMSRPTVQHVFVFFTFQLCINGECRGSICLEWGLNECFLSSNSIPPVDKRKLCELACMNGTNIENCRSTSEFASSVGLPPGGISLRPGSPCDNFQVFSRAQKNSSTSCSRAVFVKMVLFFSRVTVMYFLNVAPSTPKVRWLD